MVMTDRGQRAGLAQKALPRGGADRQARAHYLEGDPALQFRILGLQDDSHAAGAQEFEHPIAGQAADFTGTFGRRQEIVLLLTRKAINLGFPPWLVCGLIPAWVH
jgi:hypothetical protein